MFAKAFLVENVPTISVDEIFNVPQALIVDVRTAEEYTGELGHVENALLVTLGPELEAFLKNTDKKKPIVFICRSGARSGRATQYARELGFKDVYNMMGGMISWNEQGKKTVRG